MHEPDTSRDIGNGRWAEDRLAQERQLLTSIISNIPSGVFWKGLDFRYQGCNEAFAQSAGVARPEDIVGRTDYELAWDKDQADYFRACDRQVLEEDRPLINLQEAERQADGRQAILLTSKVPLHDRDGRVCGVLGIDTDISELKRVESELRLARAELEQRVEDRTSQLAQANVQLRREIAERQRAEAALRVSEERYRLVAELTSDYAYALRAGEGDDWTFEWVTDAFTRLTGNAMPVSDDCGGWRNLVCHEDLPILERHWACVLSGRSSSTEFRIVNGGRVRWIRDQARPIWDEAAARVVRVVGAAQDVTDRKQAEEEARRHQEALAQVARLSTMGELTAQLAHELNQPLCTVVGNAQTGRRLLSSPTPDLAELRDALDDIVAAGKHAGQVIRRLREFVRGQPLKSVVLNMRRLLEEVSDLLQAEARRYGAVLRFEIADDLPPTRGDPIQLQQVLLNLARNGLEAMAECQSRRLTVRACRDADQLLLSVSDEGTGLPAEVRPRMFEPFYTTKPGGLGLGLSISRSIVEAHGGKLWAEPHAGAGTTVVMALPALLEPH